MKWSHRSHTGQGMGCCSACLSKHCGKRKKFFFLNHKHDTNRYLGEEKKPASYGEDFMLERNRNREMFVRSFILVTWRHWKELSLYLFSEIHFFKDLTLCQKKEKNVIHSQLHCILLTKTQPWPEPEHGVISEQEKGSWKWNVHFLGLVLYKEMSLTGFY